MSVVFNINTKSAVLFTNKLEKMKRSALPTAVRGTLNKAAFNVKQVTMPISTDKHFVRRQQNFFKANSRVEMARGWSVQSMKSIVGFISHNLKYNNHAVKELQDQEHGGRIEKRTFIPLSTARKGDSHTQAVRPDVRLKKIRRIVDSSKGSGVNNRQKFVRSALHAGRGGFVIGNLGKKTLFKIKSIKKVGGRLLINKIPVYSFERGRDVGIKATHFMREATLKSAARLPRFYSDEAERVFSRIKR